MLKIAIVLNNVHFFLSHRLPIAVELKRQGYEVHIVTPDTQPADFDQFGFQYHQVKMSRKGMNPIAELLTTVRLYKLFKQIKPDLVHLVTIKPYLYGGIAARLANVSAVVSAVAGLGTVFIERTIPYKLIRFFLRFLYRFAFNHSNQKIIFQNQDDKNLLLYWLNLKESKAVLIRGSGVNLQEYTPVEENLNQIPVVVLASRLLKDKGVVEFVGAATELRKKNVVAEFWLVGDIDSGNPNTVTKSELHSWQDQGTIQWIGYSNQIADLFKKANLVVLPSYREGLPKVLIEAAACGRAVITTDVPGCRDAITPGVTGLLVPKKDSHALAEAIDQLLSDTKLRTQMGRAGRHLAENEFDVNRVVQQHLQIYKELLTKAI
ncbi:MAG: glycosyltransferase family 4 protein [Leptonema sp. (in: Bacteria)]|nr:glycosyltransferase family 4 protein [Leptonema sp. (in: bacteria)]